MENSNGTIGNQIHDLPSCSTVPQPTAPPCTLNTTKPNVNYNLLLLNISRRATSHFQQLPAAVLAVTAADTLHRTVSSETFCSLNKRFLHNAHHLQITHACCIHDVKSVHVCATDTTPWTQSEAWLSVS